MKKSLLSKMLAIGIIILFSGASIVSSMQSNEVTINNPLNINTLDLNDSLVGYWSFDFKTGEDESGYDNHGVLHGPGYTVGYSGFASYFDGVDDYIQATDDPSLNFHDTNQFSISAWIKRDGSLISTHESIVCKGVTEVDQGYIFQVANTDKIRLTIWDESGDNGLIESNAIIDIGPWYHLVGIWDGTTLHLYINGNLDSTLYVGIVRIVDYNKPLEIGNKLKGTIRVQPFHGIIDEVRIYERVLDKDEIQELYENPAGLKSTLMFGRIENLDDNAGSLITFEAIRLRFLQFSPFEFNKCRPDQKIKIYEDYKGLLNENFVFGIFESNI